MLDTKDEKRIGKMIFENVLEALEQAVLPRLYDLEEDVKEIKSELGGVKDEVGGLKHETFSLSEKIDGLTAAMEILDSDMGGVKMRLTSMEKKMDERTDTYFVVKDHEKRIVKLEKVLV